MSRELRTIIAIAMTLVLSHCASSLRSDSLRPFKTDGCTGFPDGTPAHPEKWRSACRQHDIAYWKGGTADQRLEADRLFRNAFAASGDRWTGELANLGFRLGGIPWLPTPWRWGFGWSYPRGYGPHSESEKAQILAKQPDP